MREKYTKNNWGRFTAKGSKALEAKLTEMMEELADTVDRVIPASQYRAFIMLGGYGRGEGGVEIKEGKEHPHNNFDFLLITRTPWQRKQNQLKERIIEGLQPFTQKYNIEIDISTISVGKLKRSPSLVMWYDMRFGHKTILGDEDFIPSLTHFRHDAIPAWDVRNLLVNRGTLLIINELLLDKNPRDEKVEKTVIKHAMKAIIGYGDALLFFLDDYDWSYVERQKNMRKRSEIPREFRNLYNEAMEFRFVPCYERYRGLDLRAWMEELKRVLANVHLFCEAKRLKQPGLTWEQYPHLAFRQALTEDLFTPRGFAKKFLRYLRSSAYPGKAPLTTRLSYRVLGFREILPVLFPAVAYSLDKTEFSQIACDILRTDRTELSKAYVAKWGGFGDTNFQSRLRSTTPPLVLSSAR